MAYAALISLARLLDQILDPNRNSSVAYHEKQQIRSLREKIVFLTAFLEEFPGEAIKFESRITVAANQVEDIFEHRNLNSNSSKYGKGLSYVLNFWQKLSNNELRKPLKEIDSISEEALQIKSSCKNGLHVSSDSSGASSSGIAPNVKGTVVGFEEDLMKIKLRLYGEPSKREIIPIVGMGGIGKTTLARYALDDPSTVHHFDVLAWVTVSQTYDIHSILLGLLNSIDASTKEQNLRSSTEHLVELVYKYLKGRRYLIVIDDIWNASVWDDLGRVFPEDLNGSRIIIACRDLEIASYVDSSSIAHQMHLMGLDQSWDLLRQKVFADEPCPPELEEIGRMIAERCRGLPLAIAVIAGVLCKVSQTQAAWRTIAINVKEAVNTSDEPFAEILSLSYINLPHHLRPCFLYMGSFPEDYNISVSEVVKLWAAEGFLKSNGSKDSEEVGEDYLEDLAKRSLVVINKRRYNGKIKTIRIHDLLRDLCLKKARDEKFFHLMYKFSGRFPKSRRLSILSNISNDFPSIDRSCIHTILVFGHWAVDSWKKFRLLRVLDTVIEDVRLHPGEIGELLHLRYLAVTFRPSYRLYKYEVPESWSKLENLQTLIIKCQSLEAPSLPLGIWRMPQLRHVIMSDGLLPDPETSDRVLALENLHTLKQIRRFTCSERILELIPNLKKLGIIYSCRYAYVTGWSKFGLNNLVRLQKLEKLNFHLLRVEGDFSESDLSRSIAFPLTLKKLTLSGCEIPWKDISIVGSLPNLQVLKLKQRACCGIEWITAEGEFCQLKLLLIDRADPPHWTTESSHFPRLESLHLRRCRTLSEIPYSIGEIPTLQLIEVNLCVSSVEESAECIKEEFGDDIQVVITSAPEWRF